MRPNPGPTATTSYDCKLMEPKFSNGNTMISGMHLDCTIGRTPLGTANETLPAPPCTAASALIIGAPTIDSEPPTIKALPLTPLCACGIRSLSSNEAKRSYKT